MQNCRELGILVNLTLHKAIGILELTTKVRNYLPSQHLFDVIGIRDWESLSPYGIHSASEIFQVEIANLIAGTEGTADSQDDIIVFAPTKEEHDRRLKQVMKNIQKAGLKLNRAKCVFGAKEIIFLSHYVSGEGIKVGPPKVSAILDMPIPQNMKEL